MHHEGGIFRPLEISIDRQHHLLHKCNKGLPCCSECNRVTIPLRELETDLLLKVANPAA
jgi:hypothetical protein